MIRFDKSGYGYKGTRERKLAEAFPPFGGDGRKIVVYIYNKIKNKWKCVNNELLFFLADNLQVVKSRA